MSTTLGTKRIHGLLYFVGTGVGVFLLERVFQQDGPPCSALLILWIPLYDTLNRSFDNIESWMVRSACLMWDGVVASNTKREVCCKHTWCHCQTFFLSVLYPSTSHLAMLSPQSWPKSQVSFRLYNVTGPANLVLTVARNLKRHSCQNKWFLSLFCKTIYLNRNKSFCSRNIYLLEVTLWL